MPVLGFSGRFFISACLYRKKFLETYRFFLIGGGLFGRRANCSEGRFPFYLNPFEKVFARPLFVGRCFFLRNKPPDKPTVLVNVFLDCG
jgi:hypothetical protein